jgi:hypothetical protein
MEFKLWRASLLEVKQIEEKPVVVGVEMCF